MAARGVCLLTLLCLGRSADGYTPHFHDYREVGIVDSGAIDEASGLCASRSHRNVLYTHNDSGGHNLIYAIDATSGDLLSTITISGAKSHDWEDIACGPCPDLNGHCVYIADTGGNYHGEANVLYKFEEPDHLHHTQTISVGHSDMLHFSWSESNCETIMVGKDAELYLVSKVAHGRGKFFHIPKSNWGHSSSVHVSSLATLDTYSSRNGPVGGDISPNGHELILKMLDHVLFWYIPHGNYAEGLKGNPQTLPYHRERDRANRFAGTPTEMVTTQLARAYIHHCITTSESTSSTTLIKASNHSFTKLCDLSCEQIKREINLSLLLTLFYNETKR